MFYDPKERGVLHDKAFLDAISISLMFNLEGSNIQEDLSLIQCINDPIEVSWISMDIYGCLSMLLEVSMRGQCGSRVFDENLRQLVSVTSADRASFMVAWLFVVGLRMCLDVCHIYIYI